MRLEGIYGKQTRWFYDYRNKRSSGARFLPRESRVQSVTCDDDKVIVTDHAVIDHPPPIEKRTYASPCHSRIVVRYLSSCARILIAETMLYNSIISISLSLSCICSSLLSDKRTRRSKLSRETRHLAPRLGSRGLANTARTSRRSDEEMWGVAPINNAR